LAAAAAAAACALLAAGALHYSAVANDAVDEPAPDLKDDVVLLLIGKTTMRTTILNSSLSFLFLPSISEYAGTAILRILHVIH